MFTIRHRWSFVLALTCAQLFGMLLTAYWQRAFARTAMDAIQSTRQEAASVEGEVAPHERASIAERLQWVERKGILFIFLSATLTTCVTVALVFGFGKKVEKDVEAISAAVKRRTASIVRSRNEAIYALAKLAEYRDSDTGLHIERVRQYVTLLAERLRQDCPEIDDEYISNLATASALHDIGKVAVPDAILLKPGKLNERERSIMKRHAQVGADCLEAIIREQGKDEFLSMARDIALCHHERADGNGYPRGLRWEEIPLSARIVSLADVYDALRSDRVYKKAMSHDEASRIIVEGAGTQFHPLVVDAFLEVEHMFQAVSASLSQPLDDRSEVMMREELEEVADLVAAIRSQ